MEMARFILSFCFNEAGAVMPRKAPFSSEFRARWLSFNEAGAVMPRKVRSIGTSGNR